MDVRSSSPPCPSPLAGGSPVRVVRPSPGYPPAGAAAAAAAVHALARLGSPHKSPAKRRAQPLAAEWTTAQVGLWLRELGFPQYVDLFAEHDVNGATLLWLDKEDLADLGVVSVGHRARIVVAIDELRKCAGRGSRGSVKKIAIEGNIAAGKSTFLRILEKEIDFVVVQEPVSKWKDVKSSSDVGGADGGGDGEVENEEEAEEEEEEDAAAKPAKPQKQPRERDGEHVSGGNLLEMFYGDPARWAFTFQTYAFLSRMRAQLQTTDFDGLAPLGDEEGGGEGKVAGGEGAKRLKARDTPRVQFFERSVYSDRYCFALNCLESGKFNEVEWNAYCDIHTWLVETFAALKLDGIVYLRTEPETCMRRLQVRSRSEEKTVSLDYLHTLHGRHEAWLMKGAHSDPVALQVNKVPKLVIDANAEFERDPLRSEAMKKQVRDFLNSL